MSRIRRILVLTFIASVLSMSAASPAWAKKKKAVDVPKPEASWVLSYAMVGLGTALGLVGMCRPGRRNKEVKSRKQ